MIAATVMTYSLAHKYTNSRRPLFGRRGRSGGSTSRQEDLASIIACRQRQITTAGLVSVCGGSAYHPVTQVQPARAQSCLTRAGYRPVVWPHEIPDSGISHRNTGSSPRSGTEAGDVSPVFAALEHAAGDFTTLGKNPPLGGSSPPSRTHRDPPLTCAYVIGQGFGNVAYSQFPQVRAMGVQIGSRLQNDNDVAGTRRRTSRANQTRGGHDQRVERVGTMTAAQSCST